MATESLRNNNKFIDDDGLDDYNRMMIDISISDFEEDMHIDKSGFAAYTNNPRISGTIVPSSHSGVMPQWHTGTLQSVFDEKTQKPQPSEAASKLALEVDGLRLRMMEENASDEEIIEMLKRISTYLDPSSRAIMEKVKGLEDGWEDLESDVESE